MKHTIHDTTNSGASESTPSPTSSTRRNISSDEKWIFRWKLYLFIRLVGSLLLGVLYKYFLYTYFAIALGGSEYGGNKLQFVYDVEFILLELFQIYIAIHCIRNAGMLNLVLYWVCGLLTTAYAITAPLTVNATQTCMDDIYKLIQADQNGDSMTEAFFRKYGLWDCPVPQAFTLNSTSSLFVPRFGHTIPIFANLQEAMNELNDSRLPTLISRARILSICFVVFLCFMQVSVVYILYRIKTQYQILFIHRNGADVHYLNAKSKFNVICLTRQLNHLMTILIILQLAANAYIHRYSGIMSELSVNEYTSFVETKRYLIDIFALLLQLFSSGIWAWCGGATRSDRFYGRFYGFPILIGICELGLAAFHLYQIITWDFYAPCFSSLITYYGIQLFVSIVAIVLMIIMFLRNEYEFIIDREAHYPTRKSQIGHVHPESDARMEIE